MHKRGSQISSAHAIFGITVVYKWPNTDRNVPAVDRNTQVLSQSGTLLCGDAVTYREEAGNIMVGRPAGLSHCSDGCLRSSCRKLENRGAGTAYESGLVL